MVFLLVIKLFQRKEIKVNRKAKIGFNESKVKSLDAMIINKVNLPPIIVAKK